MTILNQKPLNLAEVKELAGDLEEKKQVETYLKKFGKIDKKKSAEISEALRGLGNAKIRESDIVKVVDFKPEDMEDLNKIFNEVSLTEEEANAILEIVKK